MIHIMAREIASFDQTWWRVWWWYRSHIIMMIGRVRTEWDYDKQCSRHIPIILGHEYQTISINHLFKCLICSSEDMKCEVRAWWQWTMWSTSHGTKSPIVPPRVPAPAGANHQISLWNSFIGSGAWRGQICHRQLCTCSMFTEFRRDQGTGSGDSIIPAWYLKYSNSIVYIYSPEWQNSALMFEWLLLPSQ